MKYAKPWIGSDDPWTQWLAVYAIPDVDYVLLVEAQTLTVELYDLDLAQEFALEFGL